MTGAAPFRGGPSAPLRRALFWVILSAPLAACTPKPHDVIAERFPECLAPPVIGATSGVRCEHDEATDQWRITFWTGSGDCQAGCINKQETAWYLVDKDGRLYKTDKNFNPLFEIRPDQDLQGKKLGIDMEPERPGGPSYTPP